MDFVHDIAVKEQVGRLPNIGLDRLKLYQNEEVKKRGGEVLGLSNLYFTLLFFCIMFCLHCLDL